MADEKKLYTAREAAQAVLQKTHELLAKSEVLAKYETENKAAPSKAKELPTKAMERDFKNFNVEPEKAPEHERRVAKQISPSKNPKEFAEGNNKVDGTEPRYEFKSEVPKELAKENAAVHGQPKDKNGNPGLGKAEKLEKGDWNKIHSKLKREGYSEESADKIDGAIKAKMGKAENPDKDADAELGEKVEKDVEKHFEENKAAEKQEGHKLMAKNDQMTPPAMAPKAEQDQAFVPATSIVSAKLAKFMERKHAKRKAAQGAQSQAPAAVGNPAANAPAPGSTEAGQGAAAHKPKGNI